MTIRMVQFSLCISHSHFRELVLFPVTVTVTSFIFQSSQPRTRREFNPLPSTSATGGRSMESSAEQFGSPIPSHHLNHYNLRYFGSNFAVGCWPCLTVCWTNQVTADKSDRALFRLSKDCFSRQQASIATRGTKRRTVSSSFATNSHPKATIATSTIQ